MEIVRSIMTDHRCYKQAGPLDVKGLMLHSVGCSQPSAEKLIRNGCTPAKDNVCVHAYIDGNTGQVYQTLPWNHKGWHAGAFNNDLKSKSANRTHIGVEMCEPANITYQGGSSFTCSDRDKAMEVVKRTYDAAVELFAALCLTFSLDPMGDGVIISHKEGHTRQMASGHDDPSHLWDGLNSGYTMDGFRQDVRLAMSHVEPIDLDDKSGRPEQPKQPEQSSQPVQSDSAPICEGDVVEIAKDAVYYDGKAISSYVFNDQWIVKSVSGTRVVLGKGVNGSDDINSPIDVKYLTIVSKAKPDRPNPGQPAPEEDSNLMVISDNGVKFIKEFEKYSGNAYQCAAGKWTVGYGHTEGVKEGDTCSEKKAEELLIEDLRKYTGYVNEYIQNGTIKFPLTQNQFDALTSFCYNCGKGNLEKLVTDRDKAAVAESMLLYVYAGGEINEGLALRRQREHELFLCDDKK